MQSVCVSKTNINYKKVISGKDFLYFLIRDGYNTNWLWKLVVQTNLHRIILRKKRGFVYNEKY